MAAKRRILVVEDDGPVRQLVAGHLAKKGHEVVEASDAEQVLLQMSRDRVPFDLVLTDIHLPGLSGVELLRLLLTHSPLRPVIMITGDADEGLARRALGYGAAGYLLKPFELFELDATVQQALARLELVEAAESLARSDSAAAAGDDGTGSAIPMAWLDLADGRSSAGPGHGYRVARIASAIASALPERIDAADREALDLAGRAHELGRLLGPAQSPAELATRTAQLLYDLGIEARVLRVLNNLRERWNGSGGPNGIEGRDIPAASRVLAAADALDHAAVVHLEAGLEPGESMRRALDDLREKAQAHHGPDVAAATTTAAGVIEAIWVLARGLGGAERVRA
ncbi:MAG: response regulator [Gemmatimonadetes bacterium]|nr:response regulator [Gemmatimonadota bacterium]